MHLRTCIIDVVGFKDVYYRWIYTSLSIVMINNILAVWHISFISSEVDENVRQI